MVSEDAGLQKRRQHTPCTTVASLPEGKCLTLSDNGETPAHPVSAALLALQNLPWDQSQEREYPFAERVLVYAPICNLPSEECTNTLKTECTEYI
jgi:hypothetical protein